MQWTAGALIYREAEPGRSILLIRDGRAKVVLSAPTGKQMLLALRGPGELIGEFAAVDERLRSATVLALTDLVGWTVPAVALRAHLAAEPQAALDLLRLVLGRLREADLQRLDLGALDTVGRLARLLTDLSGRHGQAGWLHLTQTELGAAVGASREATVKALRRLRSAGLVETRRGRVRVVRGAGLAAVARGQASQKR